MFATHVSGRVRLGYCGTYSKGQTLGKSWGMWRKHSDSTGKNLVDALRFLNLRYPELLSKVTARSFRLHRILDNLPYRDQCPFRMTTEASYWSHSLLSLPLLLPIFLL